MVFSSFTFLLFFLPLTTVLYFLMSEKYKNGLLLAASLIFYGWGGTAYLLVMAGIIIINYIGGLLIDSYDVKGDFKLKKRALVIGVVVNLLVLFIFKYTNFFVENLNHPLVFLGADPIFIKKILLPIGISFYIFQSISYLADVYKKDVLVQKKLTNLALFISLFPQLIAGPIVRYNTIANQINSRTTSFNAVAVGLKIFVLGLAKKILIANNMGLIADSVFSQDISYLTTPLAWIGALAYTFQIYFDFSGYSDMAIGLGLIFGFTLPINFNYPYISTSITDFWRRWHISLSSWFRDYVYIPLGGNRVKVSRMYINLLIVFLATGFWHGANWTFILWGLFHGFFLVAEKITGFHKWQRFMVLRWMFTALIFIIGWVLFRSENLTDAITYLGKMFGFYKTDYVLVDFEYFLNNFNIFMFAIAAFASTPIFRDYALKGLLVVNGERNVFLVIAQNIYVITLFIVCLILLAGATYNPFIYFRF